MSDEFPRTTLTFNADRHRYTLDRRQVMGVTTAISKGLPKPALPRWAAKTAAEYVADHMDALNGLDREGIVATVKQSPWTARDRAAVRGTEVHALADRLIHGEDVQVPAELQAHVAGMVSWLDQWQPTAILTERRVASRHWWYAGTFDALVEFPSGLRLLLDWKTSRGVYGETALQTTAYGHAEFYVDDDERERPVPEVDGYAVVHVTEAGTALYRVADPDDAWNSFLHVLYVAKATDRIARQITDPEPDPSEVAA